jgi:hypothetical protein
MRYHVAECDSLLRAEPGRFSFDGVAPTAQQTSITHVSTTAEN